MPRPSALRSPTSRPPMRCPCPASPACTSSPSARTPASRSCAAALASPPKPKERLMDTVLRSRSGSVTIGADQPFCVIGERINPTGRKLFAEELRAGALSTVTVDAHAQVDAGANMLDVNAGIPLVDEPELLKSMLRTVQDAVDVPICIDSSVIEALEAGLSVYEGKALVNSVTAEDDRLEAILPLVARHGAAVIALPNDDEIPMEPQRRAELARRVVSVAGAPGTPPQDIVIDPLAMPVGAEPRAVTLFIETVRLIRDDL